MLSAILSNNSPQEKKKEESKFQIIEGRYLKIHDYLFGLGDIPNTPRGRSKLVNISINEISQLNSEYVVSSSILDFVLQAKHDEFLKKGVKVLTTRILRQINSSSFFLGKHKTGQILKDAMSGSAFNYPAVVLPIINQEKWDLFILMHPKKIFNQKMQNAQQKLSDLIQTIGGGLGGGKKKKLRHRLIHVMGGKDSAIMPGEDILQYLKQPEIGSINEKNFPYQPIHIKNQKETGNSGGYLIYSFLSQVFFKDKTLTPDLKNIEFDSWFSNIDVELDQIKHLLDQIPGTRMVEKDGELWIEKRNSFFIGTPETQNKLLDKLKMDMSPESLEEHKLSEESLEESQDQIEGEGGVVDDDSSNQVDLIVSQPTDKPGFGIELDLTKAIADRQGKDDDAWTGVDEIQDKKDDEDEGKKDEEQQKDLKNEIKDKIQSLNQTQTPPKNVIDAFEDQIGINKSPQSPQKEESKGKGTTNLLQRIITPKKQGQNKFQIIQGRYLKIHDYLFGLGDIPNTPRGRSKLVNISMNQIQDLNQNYISQTRRILEKRSKSSYNKSAQTNKFKLVLPRKGKNRGINGSAFNYPAVVLPIISQQKWDLYIIMHPKKMFNDKIQSAQQKLSDLIQTIGGGLGGGKKKKLRHRLIHVMGGKDSGLKKDILYDTMNAHFKSVLPGENIVDYLKQPEVGQINQNNCPYQPIHIKNQKQTGSSGGYLIYSFLSQVFLKNKTLTPDLKNIQFESWFSNIDEELDQIKHLIDQIPGTRVVERDGELWVEKRNSFFIGTPQTQSKLLEKLKEDMSPESVEESKVQDEESQEDDDDDWEDTEAVQWMVSEPTDKAGSGIYFYGDVEDKKKGQIKEREQGKEEEKQNKKQKDELGEVKKGEDEQAENVDNLENVVQLNDDLSINKKADEQKQGDQLKDKTTEKEEQSQETQSQDNQLGILIEPKLPENQMEKEENQKTQQTLVQVLDDELQKKPVEQISKVEDLLPNSESIDKVEQKADDELVANAQEQMEQQQKMPGDVDQVDDELKEKVDDELKEKVDDITGIIQSNDQLEQKDDKQQEAPVVQLPDQIGITIGKKQDENQHQEEPGKAPTPQKQTSIFDSMKQKAADFLGFGGKEEDQEKKEQQQSNDLDQKENPTDPQAQKHADELTKLSDKPQQEEPIDTQKENELMKNQSEPQMISFQFQVPTQKIVEPVRQEFQIQRQVPRHEQVMVQSSAPQVNIENQEEDVKNIEIDDELKKQSPESVGLQFQVSTNKLLEPAQQQIEGSVQPNKVDQVMVQSSAPQVNIENQEEDVKNIEIDDELKKQSPEFVGLQFQVSANKLLEPAQQQIEGSVQPKKVEQVVVQSQAPQIYSVPNDDELKKKLSETEIIGPEFEVSTQQVLDPTYQTEIPKQEVIEVFTVPEITNQQKPIEHEDQIKRKLNPTQEQFHPETVQPNNNDPEYLENIIPISSSIPGGDQQTSKTQEQQSEEHKSQKSDKQVAEQSQPQTPEKQPLPKQIEVINQPISNLSIPPQVEVPQTSESQIKLSTNTTSRLYTQMPNVPVTKPSHVVKTATAQVKLTQSIPIQGGQQQHGSDSQVTDPLKIPKISTQNPPGFVRSSPPKPQFNKDDANISKDLDITPPNQQILLEDRNNILGEIPCTPQKMQFEEGGGNHKDIKLDVENDLNSGRVVEGQQEKQEQKEQSKKGNDDSMHTSAHMIFTDDDNLTSQPDLKPTDMLNKIDDKLIGVRLPNQVGSGYENRSPISTNDSPEKIEPPSDFKKKHTRKQREMELQISGKGIRSSREAGCCGQCKIL